MCVVVEVTTISVFCHQWEFFLWLADVIFFSVVRELVGHGVGLDVWELPQIPNYGNPGKGPILREGMVLAIEPMFNLGTYDIETKEDGWTIVTKDRKPSAHFEHTIVINRYNTQILTEGIGENSFK